MGGLFGNDYSELGPYMHHFVKHFRSLCSYSLFIQVDAEAWLRERARLHKITFSENACNWPPNGTAVQTPYFIIHSLPTLLLELSMVLNCLSVCCRCPRSWSILQLQVNAVFIVLSLAPTLFQSKSFIYLLCNLRIL